MIRFENAILCGGKSRRMGTDKAGLRLYGRTFMEILAGNLSGSGTLWISAAESTETELTSQQMDFLQAEIVRDIYPDCGPLGGLYTVLYHCDAEAVFAVSVDTPMCDGYLGQELAGYLMPGIDAVVPVTADGRAHPLCALYRVQTREIMKKLLDAHELRMMNFLQKIRVCYVPAHKLAEGTRKLQNINTPEDYGRILCSHIERNTYGIPILSVSAYSGTGKTTFLRELIPQLKNRGLDVAVVKHDGHDFSFDTPGKDTWIFAQAGADPVCIVSASKSVMMDYSGGSVHGTVDRIHNADLILVEGLKHGVYPKILLYRSNSGKPLSIDPRIETPVFIVSNVNEWEDISCPVIGFEEFEKAAEYVYEYVNDRVDN